MGLSGYFIDEIGKFIYLIYHQFPWKSSRELQCQTLDRKLFLQENRCWPAKLGPGRLAQVLIKQAGSSFEEIFQM